MKSGTEILSLLALTAVLMSCGSTDTQQEQLSALEYRSESDLILDGNQKRVEVIVSKTNKKQALVTYCTVTKKDPRYAASKECTGVIIEIAPVLAEVLKDNPDSDAATVFTEKLFADSKNLVSNPELKSLFSKFVETAFTRKKGTFYALPNIFATSSRPMRLEDKTSNPLEACANLHIDAIKEKNSNFDANPDIQKDLAEVYKIPELLEQNKNYELKRHDKLTEEIFANSRKIANSGFRLMSLLQDNHEGEVETIRENLKGLEPTFFYLNQVEARFNEFY